MYFLMRFWLNPRICFYSCISPGFDTGDLGFFDKKNNIYLVGRGDNTFRVGHEKLCPEEHESEIKEKFHCIFYEL